MEESIAIKNDKDFSRDDFLNEIVRIANRVKAVRKEKLKALNINLDNYFKEQYQSSGQLIIIKKEYQARGSTHKHIIC